MGYQDYIYRLSRFETIERYETICDYVRMDVTRFIKLVVLYF